MEFFSRLRLIYGSRFSSQFATEDAVRFARREWAKQIGRYSDEELAMALDRVKQRLVKQDSQFYWPDVGAVLSLARTRISAAHKVRRPALPEPEQVMEARREVGRRGMKRIRAMLREVSC